MMTTWNPTTLDSFDTGESIWQKLNQLGFFVSVPSSAVTDLFKSDSNPDVDLTWTDTGEGNGVEIYRSTNGGADFTLLTTLSSPSEGAYADAGVQSSYDYSDLRYKLRYTGIGGAGPYSNVV